MLVVTVVLLGMRRPTALIDVRWQTNPGVTKTPAISPASKTPAQPCLYYENTCYRKFTKTPAV